MECHDYTNSDKGQHETFPEPVYKLNPLETQEFVKLRMSNKNLFNGKKNASMCAWRAIVKHMGIQDKMTHYQAAKKWENMRKKYREVKEDGLTSFPHWPYFTLMKDAVEGRLEGSAPTITTTLQDCHEVLNWPKRKRRMVMPSIESVVSLAQSPLSLTSDSFIAPEGEVKKMNGDLPVKGSMDIGHMFQEVNSEKHMMGRHKEMMEKEHLLLQRERAALDREVAALERDRASLDRDRAAIEREKSLLDRERLMVEKEKEEVSKDRQTLEKEKARLERIKGESENTGSEDRKERFLVLFEKLIDSF